MKYQNEYVFITDNINTRDVVARLRPQFHAEAGPGYKSKAVIPSNMGDAPGETIQTMIALKSWCIFRLELNGFATRRPIRKVVCDIMRRELREQIEEVSREDISEPVRKFLQAWAPDILMP